MQQHHHSLASLDVPVPLQVVREAIQAEKDAMAERLLHTFQGLKGLMHTRPTSERCNEASKDIMASLLGQSTAEPVGLPAITSLSQSLGNASSSDGYAAFAEEPASRVPSSILCIC